MMMCIICFTVLFTTSIFFSCCIFRLNNFPSSSSSFWKREHGKNIENYNKNFSSSFFFYFRIMRQPIIGIMLWKFLLLSFSFFSLPSFSFRSVFIFFNFNPLLFCDGKLFFSLSPGEDFIFVILMLKEILGWFCCNCLFF